MAINVGVCSYPGRQPAINIDLKTKENNRGHFGFLLLKHHKLVFCFCSNQQPCDRDEIKLRMAVTYLNIIK